MPIQRPPVAPRQKHSSIEIYWKTVTYRTVLVYILMIVAVLVAISYVLFPDAYSVALTKVSQAVGAGDPYYGGVNGEAGQVCESGRPRASEESELRAVGHGRLPHGSG